MTKAFCIKNEAVMNLRSLPTEGSAREIVGTIDYNVHLNKRNAQGRPDFITMYKRALLWFRLWFRSALAATACLLFLPMAQADSSLEVGDRAADWILMDHKGKTVAFYQDSDQRPAVLLFWASWCNTCAELMPKLDALQQQLKEYDIRFYALNIWEDAAPSTDLKDEEFNFPLLLNADRVAKRYKVRRTPGLFVVNPDKSIGYIRRGSSSNEEVVEAIKSAVAAHN